MTPPPLFVIVPWVANGKRSSLIFYTPTAGNVKGRTLPFSYNLAGLSANVSEIR